MPTVRAKFRLHHKSQFADSSGVDLQFFPVSDDGIPENRRFHQYTPGGELKIHVNNPPVIEAFQLGKSYYLDFTPAD